MYTTHHARLYQSLHLLKYALVLTTFVTFVAFLYFSFCTPSFRNISAKAAGKMQTADLQT